MKEGWRKNIKPPADSLRESKRWGLSADFLRRRIRIGAGLACVFTLILFTATADAVQIKRIQRGIVNFDFDDVVQTANLTNSVDQSKSIIILTASGDTSISTNDQNFFFTASFEDNDTISIDRGGGTSYGSVLWQVIEFEDGVRIQRGISSMQPTGGSNLIKNITLPVNPINTTTAVPIIQTRGAYATTNQTHEFVLLPTFSNASTLTLERKDVTGTKAVQIVWQVVEFQTDATVQTGAVTMPRPGSNTTTQSVTSSLSTAVTKPIIFTYFTGSTSINGIDPELYATGELTNSTVLTFIRGYAPNSASHEDFIRYYVVDLTDGSSTVQTKSHDWSTSPTDRYAIANPGSSNTSPINITTATHNYATGDFINISNVTANTWANGNWWITVASSTTFSLTGSTGNGTYTNATDYAQRSLNSTITLVDTTRTMVMSSTRSTVGNNTNTYADDFAVGSFLFNGTTLSTIRSGSAAAASSRTIVSAIEFCPITVKTPNGGEPLVVNDPYNITWANAASVANVKIEYSDDNGGTWKTIIASTASSAKSYTWANVGYDDAASPILPTLEKETDCLVRISNTADANQKDVSNAAFTIKSKLTIGAPNGSELWYVGDTNRNITWSKWGNFGSTVKLQYSVDAPHLTWADISGATALSPSAGTFSWNPIPLAAAGTTVKVRVLSNSNADVLDDSNANFENRGSITITTPNGSSQFPTGYPSTIEWTLNSNTNTLNLYYSLDNGGNYTLITTGGAINAHNVDATHGNYSWTPPLASASALSKIKAVDAADANVLGESATFNIIASIKVDQPNGGEVWKVDQVKKIKWTIGGGYVLTPYVTLYYCKNYTSSCQAPGWVTVSGGGQVDASTGGAGFDWTVPDAITLTPTVRVKIEKYTVSSIYDESDGGFTIKGSIDIIQPASAIKVPTNQNFTITWTPHGSLNTAYGSNFKLEYSNNGGTSYSDIYTGLNGSSGSATWVAANIPIDNLGQSDSMIKVCLSGDDSAPNGVYGESASFYVIGNLTLTAPNGGGSYNITNTVPINWTANPSGNGQLGTVTIAYSKNSGTDGYPGAQNIATGIAAHLGTTNWIIPDADLLYSTIRVQVSLDGDPTGQVKDASDNDFTIKGNLTLTRPSTNGGDSPLTWACGTQENITWTHQGSSMTGVDLYYSKDNGTDLYVNPIDTTGSTSSQGNTYTWTIPANSGTGSNSMFKAGDNGKNTQVRIKLALHTDPSGVSSTSAQPLTVKSRFINLVPNGGSIVVSDPFNITWTTQGDVATVKVLYSTDGGSSWGGTITASSTNADGFLWNPVNSPLDNDIRVKVESTSHSDINLSSATNITSHGKVEITTPSSTNVGASALVPGDVFRINWTTNGGLGSNVGLVDVFFAADGTSFGSAIASVDTASANFYDWTVPSGVAIPGTTNKIKVTAQNDNTVTDLSDAFDIRGKLWNGTTNHAMVAPNGGEVYYVGGSNIDVQWRYKGNIGDCDIYYSTNSGGAYPNFVATVPHNQNESGGISHHSMTVPATAGTGHRVKIYSSNDQTNVYATSQANFAVKGTVVLTAPGKNAGSPEMWYVDGNNQISFTITGGISTVDIMFDKNSGKGADDSAGNSDDYGTLTIAAAQASVNGANNYAWNIPSNQEADRQLVTTNKARVRVRDASDTTVYSDSTNDFFMKPKVTIGTISDSPWTVSDQKTITWTKTGTISQLNLYYSSAGQSGPWGAAQITGIDAAGGSTLWTVPTTAVSWGSAVVKLVRYESGVEDTDVISQTSNFTIKGKINVTAPATNQTYNVQQTGQITWNVVGAVGNVDIKYNTNSAGGYPDVDWAAFAGATGIAPDYCTNSPGTPYTFTVPANTAANVKVRVVESSHAEVFGPAMAGSPTHKFKGSIIFDKPTSQAPNTKNQTITIGPSPHRIDWSIVGTFTTLKAYYKKVGDAQWTQIGSDLGGTITNTDYSAVDSDITAANGSNKVLFRVEDALDASDVYAETPGGEGNTIIGALSMMEPITPAEFTVGSTVQVKWKKYGNIGNLKFELWNGSAWLDNAGGSNLPDSYASGTSGESGVIMVPDWAVPDKIGANRKIRVTSLTYPALTGETGTFTIKGGFNSIVTPGTWYVGEDHSISWQANGTMSSVKIELYDGSGWQTIAAAYDNGGSGLSNGANNYTWAAADTVQQQRCNNCKLKVTSNQNTNVYIETGNFTLIPKITVTTPGSSWIGESASNSITWDAIAAPTTNVDIVLIDNNSGSGYPVTLASNILKNASPYNSTAALPATLTNSAKIRVRDTSFPNLVYGDSNNFKVIGQIIMHAVDNTPNSTSNWEAAATDKYITWSHKGSLGDVNIRYKYNGGSYSAPINGSAIPVGDHSFNWTPVPNNISENVQVKIESVSNPAEEYAESAAFKIKGKFTLTDPGTLNSGAGYTIAWTNPAGQDTQITDVILEFYNGTSWNYLVASPYTVPNTETYGWTVPTNVRSTICKFRISDPDNASATDETANFEIRPLMSVTAPTSAAKWVIGTQTGNNIIWSITGPVPTVKIEYSKDNGSSYTYVITNSVAGNSSPFEWNIPADQDLITDHTAGLEQKAKIKVTDTSLAAVYGVSPGLFMVKGSITVTNPSNASPALTVLTAQNIEWTTPCTGTCAMGNVKIQFSKTGGAPWTDIATVGFATSPYTLWAPPIDAITDNVKAAKIRIEQVINSEVVDDSDGFEVQGTIAINEPIQSGLLWPVGTTDKVIGWRPTGTFSPIKLEYSKDNFVSNINTIATGVANSAHNVPKTWTWASGIPNDLSDTVKIRVSYENDADMKVVSPNVIKFVGSLDVTAPESSGIVWNVGETNKVISWDANGTITNVNIYYRTTAGGSDNTIVLNDGSHVNGGNSYTWTSAVPDEKSETCYIKVADAAHPTDIYSVSTTPFSIRPVISVTVPALDQNIEVGTSNNTVTWNINSAKVTKTDIYYSVNGQAGPFDQLISSGVNTSQGSNSFTTWGAVADTIGGDIVIKVRDKSSDVVNDNVFGLSSSFDIIGKITVNEPHLNENLPSGDPKTISWTKQGTLGNVKIYYKHDGSFEYINTVDSNNFSSYNWNPVPAQIENGLQVKVIQAASEGTADEVLDLSDAFNIIGHFTMTEPPATLNSGAAYTVQWNNYSLQGEVPDAKLEFFDGTTWHNIDYKTTDTGIVSNSGSYGWTVPTDVRSVACKFRVSDPNNATATDETNNFEIRPLISVTAPVGTAKWVVGTTGNNIVWSITGPVPTVKLEYSKDNGSNYTYVITPSVAGNSSPYAWSIPTDQDIITDHTVGSEQKARIRVMDTSLSSIYSLSALFMVKGSITVTDPSNASAALKVGVAHDIAWTTPCTGAADMGNVKIQFSKTGSAPWTDIATVGFATSPYTLWAPPIDGITDNVKTAKIRIEQVINSEVVDDSDGFEVEGNITLNEPIQSGLFWAVGTTDKVIGWTPTGTFSPIKLEYSKDNFSSDLHTIATGVANSAHNVPKTWTWASGIPNDISDTVKIRVSYENDADMKAVSPNAIKFVGSLDVTAPESAGIVWNVGDTNKQISWDSNGTITNVDIYYRTTAGGSDNVIVANDGGHVNGGNSYTWTSAVPDEKSETCYIKVADHAHPTDVYSLTTTPFSIRPVISVTVPALDQNIEVGTTNNTVTWNINSTKVMKVDIYYSTNGQAGPFNQLISSGDTTGLGSDSYTTWGPVADTIGGDIVIKVRDKSNDVVNDNVFGLSPSFDIIGKITVNEPHLNENVPSGSSKTISWTKQGTLGNVKIYYLHDGSYEYVNTVDSNNFSSYDWNPVPVQIEVNSRVKVIQAASEGTADEVLGLSPLYNIIGQFTMTEPPATLNSGAAHTVLWNNYSLQGEIPNAKIEFFDGTTWHNIDYKTTDTGVFPNSGTYSWTVPTDVRSVACKFRVSDALNPTVYDETNTFEIRPLISVTAPVGTAKWTIGTQTGNNIAWNITGPVPTVKIEYSKDNGSNYAYVITSSVAGNSSPYEWNIPTNQDIITDHTVGSEQKARIRVMDTSLSAVYGLSSLFMVKGSITVTNPNNSSPALKVGVAQDIEWTTPCTGAADMGNVKIQFSKTGSAPWTDIATVAFDASPYTLWAPPIDSITNNAKDAKMKVIEVINSEVYDDSDGFEVEGVVRIDSPDIDAPTWFVGDLRQIKWTPTGTFGYVKIEYSSNGFTNESATVVEAPTYANSAHNVQATYDWTVPNLIGSNFKVRISDVNDANVVDVSASPFVIKGKVVVSEPNGGETWYVGDTNRKIKWQATGPIPTVRIEYSKNNGGLWTEIIANASAGAGAGEYTWPSVADAISEQCLIRVSSTSDSTVSDVSNGVFFIKGKLQITAPDANTRWVAGSSGNAITWVRTGSIANVSIAYAVDGGGFTNVITNSTNAANQTFAWNSLPTHVSNAYLIKISDVDDATNVNVTSPAFKIVGSITVTKPQGGEQIKVGQNFKIEWTKAGDFANVRIEYSGNGGSSYDYQVIDSTSADTLYYWWNNIPNDKVSSNVVFKVTDTNDILTTNVSPAFKIQGIFNVLTPDGGERLVVGSDYNITWSTTGNITQVMLEYSTNSGVDWIPITATPIANTGSKSWTVPNTIFDYCRVKVYDANDVDAKDTSAGDFFIKGDLLITSPTGSTGAWLVGTTHPITWQVTGSIANVKLEFSVDGAAYEQIPTADNLPATPSSFDWQIPDRISSQVKVKITNKNDSTVFYESGVFSITGQLNLTAPVGGETWYVGDQNAISWTKVGTIAEVNLQYSVGGGSYTDITGAQNLTGSSFDWILPDIVSSQVRVRAINANGAKPTIPGVSGLFTVKGKLVLTVPASSGVVWDVGVDKAITWTRTGSVGNIRLDYDYGSGFATIAGAENLASSLQTFTWNVPNTISNNVVLRIVPLNANEADSDDSVSFKIAADLQLTSPLGGEVWVVDDSQPITWIKRGTIANVVIKYDTAAGLGGYPNTIATRPAGDGSYSWPVPDAIGDQLRVRIEDAVASSTVPDASPANFAIRGSVLVTRPVGTGPSKQIWISETQENINYTIHGSIASVEIRYSLDDGGTYPADKVIASSESAGSGTHTYPWTVPVYTSTLAKIKVTALGYSNIYDESDTFTIRGGFTMIHPLLNERWQANSSKLIEWNTLGNIPQIYIRYSLNNGQDWAFVNNGSVISNIGNYNWTIPNVISTQAKVRVTDVNDSAASVDSDSFFIHGSVALTQPNGQEKFKGGQSDNASKVKWTMQGPIPGVDLALSSNGANGTYTTFASNVQASLLEYQWSVPTNVLSNNCFIRIRDNADALVEDKSDLAFKIMDNIVVSAPSGGEKWIVGTQHNITWTSLGLAPEVNIKYCIEPTLTTWQPVASNVANAANGSYQWTIPPTISATTRVRLNAVVSGSEDADSVSISAADFMIKGNIIVTDPNGGTGPTFADKEKWGVGSQQWIRWNWQGNIDKVDIHYYNGSTWVQIDEAQGLTNTGEFEWTIPVVSTTQALVRVRDNSATFQSEVYDISDNPFKMMSRIVITQPNGSEVWYAGSTGNITWSKYGPASFNTVQIDYSVNDPTFTTPLSITPSTPNNGTYDWLNIPASAVSGAVRIRIAKPDDITDVKDVSDGDFRVRANFTLNTPNGGQKWVVGSVQTISWNQVGNTTGVKLTYYKQTNPAINGTFTLNNPYTTGTSTYDWTIPNFIHSDLLLKVEDPNDNGASATSTAVFKIMPGFTVTLPNPSSGNPLDYKWYVGDPATIAWTYAGTVDQVGIYYSLTGGIAGSWVSLTSAQASDLQWVWPSVPNLITAQLKIRVGAANDVDAYGDSAGLSKIRAKLNLTVPDGSEELTVGDSFNIVWTNVGTVNNVDLHYSIDDFATAGLPIQTNYSNGTNGGSFNWTVPDNISQTVKVRVKSTTDSDAIVISPDFRIKGSVWVKAPILNDAWEIGQGKQVKWGWKGTIPNIKITYSFLDDNGTPGNPSDDFQGPFNSIQENIGTPNDGIVTNGSGSGGTSSEATYTWTIPDQANNSVLLKVADSRGSEADIEDTSDAFKIIGYLLIKTPTVNEKLAVQSVYRIHWEWGGTMPDVGITLSTNGFADENQNFVVGTVPNGAGAGGPSSDSYYDWTVPDHISPNCKLRIYDPRVPTVVKSVSPVFKIQGAFTMTAPTPELNNNGTPSDGSDDFYEIRWVTNEVRDINWTTFGTIGNVDLVYAKDFNSDGLINDSDFAQEIAMVNGTNISNDGSFSWVVPNERYSSPPYYVPVKIRVYDHNDHDVYVQGPTPSNGVDKVKIDYYRIIWDIRDLVTNQPVAGLTVADDSGWNAQGLSSPIVHYVPAGYWTAEWTHKDYGPISESYLTGWDTTASTYRKDRTIFRTMETLVVHIWRAFSEFSYDVPTDKLSITSWLERDGSLVPGAQIIDVSIYDGNERIQRKTTLVDEVNNKLLFHTAIPDTVKLWTGKRLNNNGTPLNPDDDFEEERFMSNVIADSAPYKTGEIPIPAAFSGFFGQSWSPTNHTAGGVTQPKLQSGKVYTVVTYMGISTGATFKTPVSFSVTVPVSLKNVADAVNQTQATVNSMLDKPISEVDANLRRILAGDNANVDDIAAQGGIKGIVEDKLDAQVSIIQQAADDMQAAFDTVLTSFENSTRQAITLLQTSAETINEAGTTLQETAEKYSWKVTVAPNPGLTGDTITITLTGLPSKIPLLDIYSFDNKVIFDDVTFIETTPGLYTYQFKANSKFTAGKAYSYVVVEPTTSGFVTGSAMVESMSLTTIAGLAAAAPEAERVAKKALEAIKAVEAVVVSGENINISMTLKSLKDSVDALPEQFAKEGVSPKILDTVEEISGRLKSMAGNEGYDLKQVFEKALTESPTVKDIRLRTEEMNSVIELLQELFESKFGGKDAPVVSTSVEGGSVVFRIFAVNPSKIKPQKVQIKNYLLEEVKPRDIMDLNGLDLEYDAEKALYYVYKNDLELAPGEVRAFRVHVEDIWFIAQSTLTDLREHASGILARLEKSEYYDQAKAIADSIFSRLDYIATSQGDDSMSREQHIGLYRENVKTVDAIKEDLAKMEKILVTAGGPPAPEMLAKTNIKANSPTKTMTWIVIFLIVIFVGLLAGVLFFTWYSQTKISKEELLSARKSAFPEDATQKGKEENKAGVSK